MCISDVMYIVCPFTRILNYLLQMLAGIFRYNNLLFIIDDINVHPANVNKVLQFSRWLMSKKG